MADRRLSRIHKLIAGNLLGHQQGTIVPRGYSILVDPSLRGEARYARRIGSTFPVLMPANTMRLVQDVQQSDTIIYVSVLIADGVPVGSILSFEGIERHFVEDTVDTNEVQSIELSSEDGVLSTHDVGAPVYLHAVPMVVSADAAVDDTTIDLETNHRMAVGDRIEILADPEVPGSAVEYEVTALTDLTPSSLTYAYRITISGGIQAALVAEDTIYLRAYPAFWSDTLPIPTQATIFGGNVGPFLWDVVENRMHDGVDDVDTVLAVETVSSAFGTLDAMAVVAKNTPHWRVPIPSSSFLFWEKELGTFTFKTGARKFVIIEPNADGDFLLSNRMRPPLTEVEWRATFEALDGDCDIRIGFHIKDPSVTPVLPTPVGSETYTWDDVLRVVWLDYTVTTGVVNVVRIQSPDEDVDRIILGGYGAPENGCTGVVLRDWSQAAGRTSWIRYTLVAPVNGDHTWGSGGLQIKPYFFTSDHLQIIQRLNSGAAFL